MIPPAHIDTAYDEEYDMGDRRLVVNRADRSDANVVISFDTRSGNKTTRDAIGIPPASAIAFAIAILAARREVTR